jgi:molecular chaperone GrpE
MSMSEKPEHQAQSSDPGADTAMEPSTGNAERNDGASGDVEGVSAATLNELDGARAEAAENLDKYLRARAEFDNARRRAEIDLANAHKYSIERFAGELLAVRDSLELARTVDIAREDRVALQKMHEGLDLTLKLMDDAFRKFNLTIIDPAGAKFDPGKHHAIGVVESAEVPANHVVNVMQKGWMLHDRVLRPAMVVVARAPSGDTGGDLAGNP